MIIKSCLLPLAWARQKAPFRALNRLASMRRRSPPGLGLFAPVPWFVVALVPFVPLPMLAAAWFGAALTVILLGILAPVLFAEFDV